MILADSSVWIDALNGIETSQVLKLKSLIGTDALVMGDLILAEILQGLDSDRDFARVSHAMRSLHCITIANEAIAIQAAHNYRTLRAKGVTVRKTIDTLIATRCIVDGYALLYSDRDFDPFVEHLGLTSAINLPTN
jgi:predicted nucleic acid-binding protein